VVPADATIMLVDDEESIQKLLTYPLEREGYRVVQARDGEEALRRFAEQPVDLVVLDVMLPRLDGLEVCRRLRTDSAVPIIMLTARDDEVDKVLGLELGADDYVTKPFELPELVARIKAVHRRVHWKGMTNGRLRFGELTLDLYLRASAYASSHGLILADTKLEFGRFEGRLIWIDEAFTPDSSRYWDARLWSTGRSPASFDKQFVRDWLESTGWNKRPPAPHLPEGIVRTTRSKYLQAHRMLTGHLPPGVAP